MKCVCRHSLAAHGRSGTSICGFCLCTSFRAEPPREPLRTEAGLDPVVAASLRVLARNPAFAELDTDELAAMGRQGRKRIVPVGTILIDEGDASDRVYLLLDGHVRVERDATDETGALLAALGPGDIVGEAALLRGTRHTATVRATDDVLLLELTYRNVQDLLDSSPELRMAFLRMVHQRAEEPVSRFGAPPRSSAWPSPVAAGSAR